MSKTDTQLKRYFQAPICKAQDGKASSIKLVKFIGADGNEYEGLEFEGYASTSTKDRGNDIVEPNAFAKFLSVYEQNPILLLQHDDDKPIGTIIEAKIDTKGLYVKGIVKIDVDNIFKALSVGVIKTMSIGYKVKEFSIDIVKNEKGKDEAITILKELELFEISLVSVPMNHEASVKHTKSFKETISNLSEEDMKKTFKIDTQQNYSFSKSIEGFQKDILLDNNNVMKDLLQKEVETEEEIIIEETITEEVPEIIETPKVISEEVIIDEETKEEEITEEVIEEVVEEVVEEKSIVNIEIKAIDDTIIKVGDIIKYNYVDIEDDWISSWDQVGQVMQIITEGKVINNEGTEAIDLIPGNPMIVIAKGLLVDGAIIYNTWATNSMMRENILIKEILSENVIKSAIEISIKELNEHKTKTIGDEVEKQSGNALETKSIELQISTKDLSDLSDTLTKSLESMKKDFDEQLVKSISELETSYKAKTDELEDALLNVVETTKGNNLIIKNVVDSIKKITVRKGYTYESNHNIIDLDYTKNNQSKIAAAINKTK